MNETKALDFHEFPGKLPGASRRIKEVRISRIAAATGDTTAIL